MAFFLLALLGFGLAIYQTDQAMRYQAGFEAARADAEAEGRLCRHHVNMDFICHWRHGAMPGPQP